MKSDGINKEYYFARLLIIKYLFIMATAAETITELMDDDRSWDAMLHNFGLLAVAVTKFTGNYSTGRDLMVSNPTQINAVINQQNTIYFNHAGTNHHYYINATKMNRILAFHCWAVFIVKDFED